MAEFQRWFADTARGKVSDLVLVTSRGRFNIRIRSLALAGPPISAKNRGDVLIRDRALNQANTVQYPSISYFSIKLFFYQINYKCVRPSPHDVKSFIP